MLHYDTSFIDNSVIIGIMRRSCNCVDQRLMDHGVRVSYLVSLLLRDRPGIGPAALRDVCFLAALHDVGAYKTEEIGRMVQFETDTMWDHSIYGYLFIKYFSPLPGLAPAVLFHHAPWSLLRETADVSEGNKLTAQLICLADRLDIWLNVERRPYSGFREMLVRERGARFEPRIADLVLARDFSPFTAEQADSDPAFLEMQRSVPFTSGEIYAYLRMVIYSIDFRSRHTVTHTMTTASISNELAQRMGLAPEERDQVVCGALLHDLGKIGVPVEILEYPGKLSPQAMSVMRTHVDITATILGAGIPPPIRQIALRHHEKLDGSGYPLGLTAPDLTSGQRIVALADIVSALAGTRSYKEAYGKERILSIVSNMRRDGLVDPVLVDCLFIHYDGIMEKTSLRCQPVADAYAALQAEYAQLVQRYGER